MPLPLAKSIHKHFLKHPIVSIHPDSHLKWLPHAFVFTAKLFGMPSRSNWKKQVPITAATETIRYVTVDSLKKLLHEHQPAPFLGHHSFPSGHTASSFAGAEFLRKELGEKLPVLGFAAYAGATATALIRLGKNRHWLKDVVCGAAIGVIATAYKIFNKMVGMYEKEKTPSQSEPNTYRSSDHRQSQQTR